MNERTENPELVPDKKPHGRLPRREPKIVEDALAAILKAADALYDAALRPIPEGIYNPPTNEQEQAAYLVDCMNWQHNVAARFGRFVQEKPTGEIIYSEDSVLQMLEYMHVENPLEDSDSQAMRAVLPALLLGMPSRELGFERDQQFRFGNPGMFPATPQGDTWPEKHTHAKVQVLQSRVRALDFVRWIYSRVDDYKSIAIPHIRVVFKGTQSDFTATAYVRQAGRKQRRRITREPSNLLFKLTSPERTGRGTTAIKHDLIEQLPELDPFVKAVQRKRSRIHRITSGDEIAYAVEGLPKKNLKVRDRRKK